MRPYVRLTVNDKDITALIERYILAVEIVDISGIESDQLTLTLSDPEGQLALPATGELVQLSLGYKETAIQVMGRYHIDEMVLASPPQTITLHAHAADMKEALKAPYSMTWEAITLGQLVTTIADKHQLTPRISPILAQIVLPYLVQTEESDLHLLTRIARNHDAVIKIAHGFLVCARKSEAKTVSGTLLPTVTLTPKEVTTWNVTLTKRSHYQSVQAFIHHTDTATTETFTIGTGNPVYHLRHPQANKAAAEAKATAMLQRLQRGTGTIRLTLPANLSLMAEGIVALKQFREGVDGVWHITRITHQLRSDGFSTLLEAEIPTYSLT